MAHGQIQALSTANLVPLVVTHPQQAQHRAFHVQQVATLQMSAHPLAPLVLLAYPQQVQPQVAHLSLLAPSVLLAM
jgi:hypothetical protein